MWRVWSAGTRQVTGRSAACLGRPIGPEALLPGVVARGAELFMQSADFHVYFQTAISNGHLR